MYEGVFTLNDQEFFTTFRFLQIHIHEYHHTDNSHGVPTHFIGVMKKGHGLLISDRTRIEVSAGDVFYIPKGCRYHSYWRGEDCVFQSLGFAHLPRERKCPYALQVLHPSDEATALFSELADTDSVSAYSVGLLYTALGLMLPTMTVDHPQTYHPIPYAATQYMTEHLSAPMSEVAAACGISESALYQIFRRSLGKTPNAARQELCCRRAIDLLQTTDLSIEEISMQLGFSSSSYFRKVFHTVTGQTPRDFRKQSIM